MFQTISSIFQNFSSGTPKIHLTCLANNYCADIVTDLKDFNFIFSSYFGQIAKIMEFFLNGAELSLNSANSGNLINQ